MVGPTYQEMLHPEFLPAYVRGQALRALDDELDPLNLFNINWKGSENKVRHVLLPRELTGTDANIIVMVGREFPSGSHKVGPAYSTLMEGELAGGIRRGEDTIIGPSTGNFGIGTAYIAKLMGYPAIVIMPKEMSAERYERIRKYGGQLDLTPGSESDVVLVLERTEEYKKNPRNKVLAQFELMPNYRFHRYVTGGSALEVARGYGNRRISAFVSAPGSAGTLAAADEIKTAFPDALVCALEPRECSTLFNNGRGTHRIEGIGDKMVTLIHNVLNTDHIMLIHDDDCVMGLELVEHQQRLLENILKLRSNALRFLRGVFGISSICNILGAIRYAKYLGLGPEDNVMTIATDGFDRYPSVMEELARRKGPVTQSELADWFEGIYRVSSTTDLLDVRGREQKQRLFDYKQNTWAKVGYSRPYLESMKSQVYWDTEYDKIRHIDEHLVHTRQMSVSSP
ncbi:MAG TPA: pyridoxal-phosphate dependent enzyme [Terriglobales bacterium]|nr:pyridoxal-phosphate dependent enzyme [Terriglobales bacterium]